LVTVADSLAVATGVSAGPPASIFLKSAMNCGDSLNALAILMDDPNIGVTVLRKAFSATASVEEFIPTLVSFISFLGQEKFSTGTTKLSRDACYEVIYGTAGLMIALTASLTLRSVEEKQILAWFLMSVCLSNSDARTHSAVVKMARELCGADGVAIEAMKTLVFPHEGRDSGLTLDAAAFGDLDHLQALNPQHDNDFPMDYRRIQIIPTASEINADPLPGTALAPRASSLDEAAILDRQFRLLREDMVAPIISEIKELQAANKPQAAAHQNRHLYSNPVLVDVGVDRFHAYVLLLVPIPPHLMQRLSKVQPNERREFCSKGPGRRILARDSLQLFLNADCSVRCAGRVVRRDNKEFLRHDGYFCVGVEFSDADLPEVLGSVRCKKFLTYAKGGGKRDSRVGSIAGESSEAGQVDKPLVVMNDGDAFTAFVFQVNSSVFAYEPILRSLQGMSSIPFKHELVLQRPPLPLPHPVPLSERAAAALTDDPRQREAVLSALQQRVCLVQGPPGTGKTFVGVQIVRALLDEVDFSDSEEAESSSPVRILCLCYTNHALDDFLLSLHEEGGVPLEDMVRLGRSPKIHEKLKSRTLSEHGDPFNRLQARKFAMAKVTMQGLEDDINA